MTQRRGRERGLVIPLVALVLTTLVTFTAIAIDLGYQRVARRDMQALADVVALDLARLIDGRTVVEIEADPAWANAQALSLARNDDTTGDPPALTVLLGSVNDSTGAFTAMSGAQRPTAVQVEAATSVDYFFHPGSGGARRTAVATRVAAANFMIGSFLAAADPDLDSGVLNRLLPRFLGSAVDSLNLSLLSYQGLADATMDLGRLSTQLGAGSPQELLTAGVFNARDFYLASADVMEAPPSNNTAAASVFEALAANVSSTATLDLRDVFLQQGGPNGQLAGGTNLSVPALFFLTSSVFAIDGNNLVNVPNFDLGIPGVTSTNLTLEVIERAQYCEIPNNLCRVGRSVTTAQTRVRLENQLDLDVSTPLLPGANLTGSLVTDTSAAGATGTLTAARCPGSSGVQGIDVSVVTQPITTTATENLRLRTRVEVPLVGPVVTNVADVVVNNNMQLASGTDGVATFAYATEFLPTVGTGSTKRVGSPSLEFDNALGANAATITVLGGAGVPLGTVTSVVDLGLAPVLGSLENFVLRRLSRTLGLDIGGADVGAVDLACDSVALVG